MPHDFGCNVGHAAHVGVAVLFAEAKFLGQVRTHDVAVEERDLTAMLLQQHRQHGGCGGFAGSAQAG